MKDKVTFTMKNEDPSPQDFLNRELEVRVNLRHLAENMQTIMNCLTGEIPRLNKDCLYCRLFQECTIVIASIPIMLSINSFMERLEKDKRTTQ